MLLRPVDKKGLLLWLVLAMAAWVTVFNLLDLRVEMEIVVSVSVSAFFVMTIDKIQSIQGGRRLSERSLYTMALLGGSLGVILGIYLLHHKSRKTSFKIIIFLLTLLQIALVYYLLPDVLTF